MYGIFCNYTAWEKTKIKYAIMQPDPPVKFHANGKLLISGEYAVLDGALALALPTTLGQTLEIFTESGTPGLLYWESYDHTGKSWFQGTFRLSDWSYLQGNDPEAGHWISLLGREVLRQNHTWLQGNQSIKAVTRLEFPRSWGLGSSSTLVSLFAAWAGISPFDLLKASFGGSGYDIACAQATGPILYQRHHGIPGYVHVPFHLPFLDNLYFLYLEKKQNSREGIARYKALAEAIPKLTATISALTWQIVHATQLAHFNKLLKAHEQAIGAALQLPPVQEQLFPDYWGAIKSLGAWGGDFVLVTSERPEAETRAYFEKNGYPVCMRFDALINTKAFGGFDLPIPTFAP